jgi:DNA-binding Lrp family transcriptional regulator
MDDKDSKIIELLEQNADLTTSQIGKKLNIPITTVHNRIKKLKETGVIKKFTIKLDYKKLGRPMCAYVLIATDYMQTPTVAERLRKIHFVDLVSIIGGDFDIIIRARLKDAEELEQFVMQELRKVGGVNKTQTVWVMKEVNGSS